MNKDEADRIDNALSDLRMHVTVLIRRWRLRRAGEDLRRTFAAVDAALLMEPQGSQAAFYATLDLLELLESRAPAASVIVDPVLDAARALFRVLAGEPAGHPPSEDCPICAVLARHGRPTADGAMLGS